jgi:hypothetical protein
MRQLEKMLYRGKTPTSGGREGTKSPPSKVNQALIQRRGFDPHSSRATSERPVLDDGVVPGIIDALQQHKTLLGEMNSTGGFCRHGATGLDQDLRRRLLAGGAAECPFKPLSASTLREALNTALRVS